MQKQTETKQHSLISRENTFRSPNCSFFDSIFYENIQISNFSFEEPSVQNYLDYHGNSMEYVQQFINAQVKPDNQCNFISSQDKQIETPNTQAQQLGSFSNFQWSFKKQEKKLKTKKRSKTFSESSYHNFQKHLFRTLNYIIKFSQKQQNLEVQEISKSIWSAIMNIENKTKKILRFTFSEKWNNKAEIKCYGLQDIYTKYGDEKIQQAREYLNRMAQVQLTQYNVMQHVNNSKIKEKEKFIDYVMIFKKELEKGEIKKRINCENQILISKKDQFLEDQN